jgi:predicted Zn-dependent protease
MHKIFSSFLILFFISGCFTVEGTKRRQLNIVPDGKMNELGTQAYAEILSKEKISNNQKLTQEVREIGERIAKASGANLNWEFNLIDSPQINAFCLPGGKVAVYTGILKVAKNRAGLATVMSHEIAHAIAKHGAERMTQGIITQAGLALADLSMGDNRYKGAIMASLGVGAQIGVLLPFSRAHESEADVLGLQYMAKAGYDPSEAAQFWKRMKAASGGGPPQFLSTHPSSETRSNTLSKLAQEYKTKYYAKSDKQPNRSLF